MSFMNTIKVATEGACKARWSCAPPGERFRCAMCGHKLIPGDEYAVVYTNDMRGCWGNPIFCSACFEDDVQASRNKWAEKCTQWEQLQEKYWFFVRED